MEWQYWHYIREVNPERPDLRKQIRKGMCVSYSERHNGIVETFNLKTGKESWMVDVIYLCRLPKELPPKIKIKELEEAMKKKGLKKGKQKAEK